MKKRYENKRAESEERPRLPRALKCTGECDIPGLGFWQKGDIIFDQRMIAIIGGNPNFEPYEEGQQP